MPTIALSTGSLYTYGLARVFDLAAEFVLFLEEGDLMPPMSGDEGEFHPRGPAAYYYAIIYIHCLRKVFNNSL